MANVVWMESGSDATQDTSPWSGVIGSPASSTTQKRTGPRSIKCDSGAGNAATCVFRFGVMANAGRCASIGFYLNDAPSADTIIAQANDSGHIFVVWHVRYIAASGLLELWNAGTAGSKIKAGTHVFTTAAWHRLSISGVFTSTSNWSIKVYVDGALEISATNADATLTRIGPEELTVGWVTAPGANKVCYVDDVYVDDTSDLTDCGDIKVTAKRPIANGTANDLTTQIGSGGSGSGTGHSPQVNEQPLSTTNGWSLSLATAGGTKIEEYSIESRSAGDVDITNNVVVGLLAWVHSNTATASNNTTSIILAGATTAITLTTTAAHYFAVSTTSSFPAGNTDVGLQVATSSASARLFRLFEAGILVAYRPLLTGTLGATMTKATAALTGSHVSAVTSTLAATMQKATAALVGVMQPSGSITATLTKATASLSGSQKHSGAMAAQLQKALFAGTGSQTHSGVLGATLTKAAASLVGVMHPSGVIGATLTKATASLTGGQTLTGTLAATMTKAAAALAGAMQPSGAIAATLTKATAALAGGQTFTGTITATLQKLTASLAGTSVDNNITGVLGATLTTATASLAGVMQPTGALAATLTRALFAGAGAQTLTGALASTMTKATAALAGEMRYSGVLGATLQKATASLSGAQKQIGVLTATLTRATAALVGREHPAGQLAARLQAAVMAAVSHLYAPKRGVWMGGGMRSNADPGLRPGAGVSVRPTKQLP